MAYLCRTLVILELLSWLKSTIGKHLEFRNIEPMVWFESEYKNICQRPKKCIMKNNSVYNTVWITSSNNKTNKMTISPTLSHKIHDICKSPWHMSFMMIVFTFWLAPLCWLTDCLFFEIFITITIFDKNQCSIICIISCFKLIVNTASL